MTTATEQMIRLDIERNKARQYAAQIVYELRDYIPPHSMSEAQYHLTEMFHRAGVEITTAEARRVRSIVGGQIT